MKMKNIKCTISSSKLEYNEELEQFTCPECNTIYEKDIFKFSKERKFTFRFKKYGLLIALLAALYLIYLTYRIFLY